MPASDVSETKSVPPAKSGCAGLTTSGAGSFFHFSEDVVAKRLEHVPCSPGSRRIRIGLACSATGRA